jgi:hypothetical protein
VNVMERFLAAIGAGPPDDMESAERRHRMWGELCDLSAHLADFVERWWEMDPELRRHHVHRLRPAEQLQLPLAPRHPRWNDDLPF